MALGEPFVDYGGSLFCDSAVTGSWNRESGVLPYTLCQTMDNGWCWQIELADRVNRGYVFSFAVLFCRRGNYRIFGVCNPLMSDECRTVKFRSGRYQRFWVGNVAAIGNASGFVEPLESTGLHMVAVTARTLGQALVDTECRPPHFDEGSNQRLHWPNVGRHSKLSCDSFLHSTAHATRRFGSTATRIPTYQVCSRCSTFIATVVHLRSQVK